ncbi:MAG: hypothetical protein HY207_09585 [Nitrospirae bacterium]|nr:hypothetical protein [Nitrospirota bacterium]
MRTVVCIVELTAWALTASLTWAADAVPSGGGSGGTDANVERFLMEGSEIQGTLEKPHVVYVVPWKDATSVTEDDIPLHRSFEQEIVEPVDRARFQRQFSQSPAHEKGGPLK